MQQVQRINDFIDKYLISVQKPGRYIGGEFNQIKKKWDSVDVHFALAFPDIYDIGFSNLGIAILYHLLNNRDDCLTERVYAPWFDMDKLLLQHNIPLFSLESNIPLDQFDVIGFSIPYETLYTNVLNMLHLSKLPLKTHERKENHPLIIAGGQSTFNPEPMYSFIDAFVLGEGEEVIHEIVDVIKSCKHSKLRRFEIIDQISRIDGLYVPDHFDVKYNDDSSVKSVRNTFNPEKKLIKKRIVKRLHFPIINSLVPNVSVVHDRLSIEIMRGCPHGCRFCYAGMVNRPTRERNVDEVIKAMRSEIRYTGVKEVSLLSLSTSDHSKILDLIDEVNKLGDELAIDFSLPSLRIESFDSNVINSIQGKRKGNFTFAPEAGSDRLRSVINKPIPHQAIIETISNICEKGWNNIKLYFMIGFPQERLSDIEDIFTICKSVQSIGRKASKGKIKLHVSVNVFIPKAHTPFQWVEFPDEKQISEKFDYLVDNLKKIGIKVDYSDYQSSLLESVLSRGDRKLSDVIYSAWENGAKFDAWHEGFNPQVWKKAFQAASIDMNFYSKRARPFSEVFPWDHIDVGVKKRFLLSEYRKSIDETVSPVCHEKCLACGIQTSYKINCRVIRTRNEHES